jgi:alpha-mannosidase
MWAADEATYRQAFLDMLDYYLNQIDSTATSPSEYQGRWTCDCSLWVRVFEDNRPASAFARLISRIRDGHISVAKNTLVPCYGAQPAEAVLRGMFYAGSLERRFGLDLPIAQAMENQTLPFGLGALWAGSGVRYSWRGVCNCATKLRDLGSRANEIYWWTGLDGSRILMKWNSAWGQSTFLGGYAEAYDPVSAINFVDSDPQFTQRYPYPVIGAFGKGWDGLKTLTNEFLTAAATQTNATRKVIVSNERDFFEDFDATCGAQIPSQSLAFGNEWDVYSASMAEVSSRVRRAVEKLRNAEALATLVSLKDQAFMSGRTATRDRAWLDLGMYWDHDWTGDGAVKRPARAVWERRLADEIEQYVDTLHSDAAQALGALIPAAPGVTRFYAFNALGWARTDQADLPWTTTAPVKVFEVASGREVPSQIVTVDGQRALRVLAEAVPAVGYKVYEIRPSSGGSSFSDAATAAGSVLANEFHRVTLNSGGAITSLVDLGAGNREFAATIGGRALNDLGSGTGSISVENAGPVSVTLKAVSASPVQHTTRITLTRGLPRVAIRNDIEQNFNSVLTWGFGLNLASPDVNHEEVGAVIRARTTAQGGQYSVRNARYDWL